MDQSIVCQQGISIVPQPPSVGVNPHMADRPVDILRERVRQRLEATGKSAHAVSVAIGANRGYVRDLLDPEKTGMPGAARLRDLAEELDTTTEYLMGAVGNPAQVQSEVSIHDVHRDWIPERPTERGIPLVGTGDCAELSVVDEDGHEIEVERSSFDPDYHVRYIKRPSVLAGDRKAYAIYFHGSSMEPRFFAGEIGIVQPDRHAGPGDYVLAQINDGTEDHVVSVLVKRLVRQTSQFYELEQYNPPAVFRLPKRQVTHLHRIMLPNELLG